MLKKYFVKIAVGLATIAIVVTAVYAWVVNDPYVHKDVILKTGNATDSINVDFLIGKDFDYNGTLDRIYVDDPDGGPQTELIMEDSKMSFVNDNWFTRVQKEDITKISQMYENRVITYKVLIEHINGENPKPINIDMFFTDLLATKEDPAALMFQIKNLVAYSFTTAEYQSFDYTEYTSIRGSRVISPFYSSKNLWDLSRNQEFTKDLLLKVGYTMEINILIECLPLNYINNFYNDYGDSVIGSLLYEIYTGDSDIDDKVWGLYDPLMEYIELVYIDLERVIQTPPPPFIFEDIELTGENLRLYRTLQARVLDIHGTLSNMRNAIIEIRKIMTEEAGSGKPTLTLVIGAFAIRATWLSDNN